jgi:hypothetical protein
VSDLKTSDGLVKNEGLHDFIAFKKLICTTLIQIVYMIGFAYITISGIIMFFPERNAFLPVDSNGRILLGLAVLVIGNLTWRIFCESLIVLFRIHDSLAAIEKSSKERK